MALTVDESWGQKRHVDIDNGDDLAVIVMTEYYTSEAGHKYEYKKKRLSRKRVIECPDCGKAFDPKKYNEKCPKCQHYI